jgi:hypothetical protein
MPGLGPLDDRAFATLGRPVCRRTTRAAGIVAAPIVPRERYANTGTGSRQPIQAAAAPFARGGHKQG